MRELRTLGGMPCLTILDLLIAADRQFGNSGVVAWAAHVRGSEPLEPYRTENYHAAREWLRAQEKCSE